MSTMQAALPIRGEMIHPGDARYDGARAVHQTGIDRRPALIVRPQDTEDVAAAVLFARAEGLPLAVRSGGHGFGAHCISPGGLTLDLRSMNSMYIDAERRTAWADAGLSAGEVTRALGGYDRAIGFGDNGAVGIGGITLGGGVGFLHRRFGLTLDNVLAVEVVTAAGDVVYADDHSNADLFWAVRGGGGNFGVVTRIKYALQPLSTVVGGMMMLRATPARLASFVQTAVDAPDELCGIIAVLPAPPMPNVPPELYGQPLIFALMAYAGTEDDAARALAPLRGVGGVVADGIRPLRYAEIFEHGGPPPMPAVSVRSFYMDEFDDVAAGTTMHLLEESSAPMHAVQFRVLGGAVARVARDETAFVHRDRRIMGVAVAAFSDVHQAPEHDAWTDDVTWSLRQGGGAYPNFLGNVDGERVRDAYGAAWPRLRSVKAAWDPDNFFSANHNIPPAL